MGTKITMRDVAREAGVSPMTVSRAFKQDASVNAETRAQVQKAADRLGYVYDATAQSFRAGRSGFVAVTLPSINNANFASTHRALTRALAQSDLQLLLGVTNYNVEEEERHLRQLLARRPEAIVLTGGHHTDATRRMLSAMDVPVIEIWDLPPDPIAHVVGFSNATAMELVVDHLVATGRRKLGFIGATGDTDKRGAERRNGVVQAARSRGLPDVVLLDAGKAPVSMSAGADVVSRNTGVLGKLDALICVSDPVAFGAMMALQRLGLSVPNDLAITGFGAFEISQIAQPSITTVNVWADLIGQKTGEMIESILNHELPAEKHASLSLEPQLVRGHST